MGVHGFVLRACIMGRSLRACMTPMGIHTGLSGSFDDVLPLICARSMYDAKVVASVCDPNGD